jgi:predicted nucleic acid-binding protein
MTAPSTFLVDSNILVYAYDAAGGEKRFRAGAVLRRLREARTGALSVQILGEFYNALTTKIVPRMAREEAADRVQTFARSWPVLGLTPFHVREAVRICGQHQLSYWESLILATARLNSLLVLLSEDMQDGQLVEGVRIRNPLTADFDLTSLG